MSRCAQPPPEKWQRVSLVPDLTGDGRPRVVASTPRILSISQFKTLFAWRQASRLRLTRSQSDEAVDAAVLAAVEQNLVAPDLTIVRALLEIIAWRRALDQKRKLAREPSMAGSFELEDPDEPDSCESREALRRALPEGKIMLARVRATLDAALREQLSHRVQTWVSVAEVMLAKLPEWSLSVHRDGLAARLGCCPSTITRAVLDTNDRLELRLVVNDRLTREEARNVIDVLAAWKVPHALDRSDEGAG